MWMPTRKLGFCSLVQGIIVFRRNLEKWTIGSKSSSVPSDLKGRDLITFDRWTATDIHTLLWSAIDLKQKAKENQGSDPIKASIFFVNHDFLTKLGVTNATCGLSAALSCVHETDIHPSLDLEFFGRSVSSGSDAIFIESQNWDENHLEAISVGSSVPVVNFKSVYLAPVLALAEIMSLYEHYGFLRRLTVSYIGPGDNQLLNTYATLLPKLGIHLRYVIDGSMNDTYWQLGLRDSARYHTDFKQCDNLADAIFRATTVSTCYHNMTDLFITMKDIKEMDFNWTLFHHQLYKSASVSTDIINSKHSLVWKAIENLDWISRAIIASLANGYFPSCIRPDFEGQP